MSVTRGLYRSRPSDASDIFSFVAGGRELARVDRMLVPVRMTTAFRPGSGIGSEKIVSVRRSRWAAAQANLLCAVAGYRILGFMARCRIDTAPLVQAFFRFTSSLTDIASCVVFSCFGFLGLRGSRLLVRFFLLIFIDLRRTEKRVKPLIRMADGRGSGLHKRG